MISFESLVLESGIPIYLQILLFVKRGAVAGNIHNGDELPSRRVLSALLGVNPNTVQKAYRMLEEEHLLISRSGAKSCMVLTEDNIGRIKSDLLEADAKNAVRALKQMGISKAEAVQLLNRFWNELEGED